jgi:hypothetical protein
MNIRKYYFFDLLFKFVRYLLSAIFIYAGIMKLIKYDGFYNTLFYYTIVPNIMVRFISYPIIFIEIWLGFCLLINSWEKKTIICMIILLVVFIIALSVDYIKGYNFACGCGLPFGSTSIGISHILQNGFLLLLLLILFMNNKTKSQLSSK